MRTTQPFFSNLLVFLGSYYPLLEHSEDLLNVQCAVRVGLVGDDVELHSLGQRAALADGDDVTLTDVLEGGGAVHGHVLMPLLKSSVLANVLQVISADDNSALHLVRDDHALEDSATDGHVSCERALLVHIVPLDSELGGLESQANALVVSHALGGLLSKDALGTDEDSILLLVSLLGLFSLLEIHYQLSVGNETRQHNEKMNRG